MQVTRSLLRLGFDVLLELQLAHDALLAVIFLFDREVEWVLLVDPLSTLEVLIVYGLLARLSVPRACVLRF